MSRRLAESEPRGWSDGEVWTMHRAVGEGDMEQVVPDPCRGQPDLGRASPPADGATRGRRSFRVGRFDGELQMGFARHWRGSLVEGWRRRCGARVPPVSPQLAAYAFAA